MGSCTHIVDDREILNQYEYDVWGNIVSQKETVKNRFKFNGQQLDPITQQYYLRARFYNPIVARFTQEDTYRGDGLNLYSYCANNPVYYVDPSGNTKKNICKGSKTKNEEAKNNNSSHIPCENKVLAKNNLYYQSNPKHTKGGDGNRNNAGIEPKNSLDLFNESIAPKDDLNIRFAYDKENDILHRFFNDGNGVWHWSGSTKQGVNSLKGKNVPIEIKRIFKLRMKGW